MQKNRKATAIETSVLGISGALAAGLAAQLADHGVGVYAIVSVVAFTLTSGFYFAARISQALRTTFYACPVKGCAVSIRAQNATNAELDRHRAYATDHTKHGAAR